MAKILKSDVNAYHLFFLKSSVYIVFLALGLMTMSENVCAEDKNSAEAFTDLEIHAGKILTATTTVSSIRWLDLEKLMLSGNLRSDAPKGTAETDRKPEGKKLFVILEVQLSSGMTIGKYDYKLEIQEKSFECEGLAVGDNSFDPRKWEVNAEDINQPVKLLYEVPRFNAETSAVLTPTLDTTVSLEKLELTLQPPPAIKKKE